MCNEILWVMKNLKFNYAYFKDSASMSWQKEEVW